MTEKQRSDALSEKLSAEQSRQVLHWLSDHTYPEVAAMISAPEPEGFGIPTSTAAVGRFARLNSEHIGDIQFEQLDDLLLGVNAKYRKDIDFHESLDEGSFRVILEKVFRRLAESNPDPRELKLLANVARIAGDRLAQQRSQMRQEALQGMFERLSKHIDQKYAGQPATPKAA